jgi:mycothiol system anti-sigma-R factor
MSKNCNEVRNELDAHVDGELEEQQSRSIEEHFKNCQTCLQLYRFVIGVKNLVRGKASAPPAPAHLRAKIMMALDEEDSRASSWLGLPRWLTFVPAPALGLAAVLVLFFALGGPRVDKVHNFTEISMMAWDRLNKQELRVQQPESDIYEQQYEKAALPEQPAPSLANIDYECEGCCFGLSVERPVAHYLYRNAEGEDLSLVMWRCLSPEDRIVGERYSHEGQEYYVAEREGVRLVMWQQKEVFFSVFGEQPMDSLLQAASAVRSSH